MADPHHITLAKVHIGNALSAFRGGGSPELDLDKALAALGQEKPEEIVDELIAIYRRLPDQDSDACTCTECTVSAVEQDPTMAGLSPAPQPGLRMASDDTGSPSVPADSHREAAE